MSEQPPRVFDTAFKQALMLRLAGGETLAGLAKETGIRRKSLYEWRNAYRKLGVAGLNRTRGPKPGGKARAQNPSARRVSGAPPGPDDAPETRRAEDALAQAQAHIAELERVIGRQQVDLDFFQKALRLMGAKETQVSTAAKSTRSSKP